MEPQLVEISAAEWLEHYNQTHVAGKLKEARLDDDLFSCMQWTGLEVINKTQRQYWALQTDEGKSSFVHSYALSQNVIRLRGLLTRPEFRKRGYMSLLLRLVVEKLHSDSQQFMALVTEGGLRACMSAGFKKVEDFRPRYVESKSVKDGMWVEDRESLIYMVHA